MARTGRADINLTLGIDPAFSARRIANEMTEGFKQAGNQAGLDYNESFSRQIDQLEPRVARAMRKTSAALLQVDEASAKVASRFIETTRAQEGLAKATDDYNRVVADATAGEQDRVRALESVQQAEKDAAASTRLLIAERAKLNRANASTASSLALVDKALGDIGKEQSAGQTLLTTGKFISALRAVAIPAVGAVAAIGGASVISGAAALTHALWMIPAGAGAAAAAIGSVKIATLGFSDAIENMSDPEKFYEALQNLSPNAQQAALAVQALLDPLRQLKNATQDAFFADAAPMINQLAQQYLPMIEQLTTGIGGAFNSAFKSVFNQLLTPDTQAVLQDTVNNLVLAFERLAPAAGPFVDAITRIVQTGASYLPDMASAITDAAEGFADFIKQAQDSGDLERWFQLGIDAASAFWDLLKTLGKAFVALAPTGVKAIREITTIIEGLTPPVVLFMNNLNAVLGPIAGIAEATKQMYNVVGPIFERIGSMIDKIGNHPLTKLVVPGWARAGLQGLAPSSSFTPMPSLFPAGGSGSSATDFDIGAIFGLPKVGPAKAGEYRTRDGKSRRLPRNPNSSSSILDGLFGVPDGGYPMPAAPPDKSSGSGSKADEPPFTADPSLYSLDSVPIGSFPGDAAASSAPMAASPDAVAAGALPPVNMAAIPQLLGTNAAISAIGGIAQGMGIGMMSGIGGPNSPTNRPFDGAHHDYGQAGDFSNSSGPTPEMRNLALWLASNFGPLIEELIYNDDMGGVGIKSGVPVDAAATFGATDHRNHVHVAVRDEIVPQFLQAMQENLLGGFAGDAGYFSINQDAITNAENDRLSAKEAVEEARLRVLELEAKGDATQSQLLAARNNVLQANRRYDESETKLAEARQGSYKKFDSQFTKQAKDTTDSLSNAASGLSQIGASLANDFGISEGLPGIAKWLTTFLANLAFAPALGALTAVSAVGNANSGTTGASGLVGMFAPPVGPMDASAMGPTPLGGGVGTQLIPAQYPLMKTPLKFDQGGMLPPGGVGVNMTNKPEPVLTPDQWTQVQGAMQSSTPVPHGTSGATPGPQAGPPSTEMTSRSPSQVGGGGFAGLGGMPMQASSTAVSAAGLGLDAFAPGAGQAASAAAQIGIQLANRAAGYAGQVAGIAVGGLMETFLPSGSEVADPSKSWIGRIASGISGARPATANAAGGSAPAKPPTPQPATATAGGGGPVVLIENMVNQTPDGGQAIANQVARQAQTGYMSRMGAR
jgi:hypothetical protein